MKKVEKMEDFVYDNLEAIAEKEFDPDIVHMGLYNCYDEGFNDGFTSGAIQGALALCIGVVIGVGTQKFHNFIRNRKK